MTECAHIATWIYDGDVCVVVCVVVVVYVWWYVCGSLCVWWQM